MEKLVLYFKNFFATNTERLPVILVGALVGITVLVIIFQTFDLMLLAFHDRRIRKNGITLKILPQKNCTVKELELLIKNIHGMLLNTKWRKYVYGRPYISFEVLANGNPPKKNKEKNDQETRITFYVWVPKNYCSMLIERIHATYPGITIEPCESAAIIPELHRKQSVYCSEMELGYHHMLRIQTKSDANIIYSILSNMKNLQWHEKAMLQVLVRPLDNSWQLRGRKVLEDYERNNKRPLKRGNIAQLFAGLKEEFGKEFNELVEARTKKEAKTRMDRREIRVSSEKLIESGFEVVIRILTIGNYGVGNRTRNKAITSAFNELDLDNRFKRRYILNHRRYYRLVRIRKMPNIDRKNILTTSELANFFLRLPGEEELEYIPEVEKVMVRELPPPVGIEKEKNIIGENHYRGTVTPIGIADKDLKRHVVIQGATGCGKSEMAKTFAYNHILAGRGLMLLEPHGKLIDEFLELIPKEHHHRVVWCDLFDDHPFPFNFCKIIRRSDQSFEDTVEKTVTELIDIFSILFRDTWSSKNAHFFINALKTIIEMQDGGNIGDLKRLFTDKAFREYAVRKVRDLEVRDFWLNQFNESRETEQTVLSIMHKLGQFLNSKKIMRSVCQEDCIDFLDIVNNNKILLFRFSKDNMSEKSIKFIGSIAIKLMIIAAFQRDKSQWDTPFLLMVDEAQNFITPNIKTVIYELRKYGVALFPMHQGLEQLEAEKGLKEALYGNVGTIITFMTGNEDSKFFEQIHQPRVTAKDIENLPSRHAYVRTMVDGAKTKSFNIYTIDSPTIEKHIGLQNAFEIKKLNMQTRKHYKEIDRELEQRITDYISISDNERKEDFKVAIEDDDEFIVGQKDNSHNFYKYDSVNGTDDFYNDAFDEEENEYQFDIPDLRISTQTEGEDTESSTITDKKDEYDIEIKGGWQGLSKIDTVKDLRAEHHNATMVEKPIQIQKGLTIADIKRKKEEEKMSQINNSPDKKIENPDANPIDGKILWEIEKEKEKKKKEQPVDEEKLTIQEEGALLWGQASKQEKDRVKGRR